MPIDAEQAIEKGLEVAEKAGLLRMFLIVVGAKRTNLRWEIIIHHVGLNKKFKAEIDADTGDALEWSEVS
jgi:hypothetical protein